MKPISLFEETKLAGTHLFSPMVSPDGARVIFGSLKKSKRSYYQIYREENGWSSPEIILFFEDLKKTSAFYDVEGFNGKSLFFISQARGSNKRTKLPFYLYQSNLINGQFRIPSLASNFQVYQNYINEDLTDQGQVSYFQPDMGNPNKAFVPTPNDVIEWYFNEDITQSKKLPKQLIEDGYYHMVAVGSNAVFFGRRYSGGEDLFFSFRKDGEWSLPTSIIIDGLEEEYIYNLSYSEETNEVYCSSDGKIYYTKLPDELVSLISTNYKSDFAQPVRKGIASVEPTPESKKSKYYALLIGIEDYKYNQANLVDLSNPIGDAEKLKSELVANYTFEEENITILKSPDRGDIINSFEQIANVLTEQDNLLIFYAGHGVWDEKLNIGYWLSSDATTDSKTNWISNSTVRDYIAGLNTKHTLLISDACFSGSIFKTREVTNSIDDFGFSRLYKLPSRKAMTSGTLNTVPDDSKFMKYLLKALSANEKEYFPSKQLFHEIEIAIINNTANVPQFGTIQNTGDEGGDFIFIKKEKE